MGKPKTVGLPGNVVEQFERVQSWMQEHRGTKVYPYQVIGEVCRRWLDKHDSLVKTRFEEVPAI